VTKHINITDLRDVVSVA